MLKLLIALTLFIAVPAQAEIGPDKHKHFVASGIISSATFAAFKQAGASDGSAFMASLAFTLSIGHLKESTDDFYDKEDMVANLAGALVVPVLWISF